MTIAERVGRVVINAEAAGRVNEFVSAVRLYDSGAPGRRQDG